ncbi:small s [Fusarium albosuccineum]|uniref:Small s n=1 Tax=Fusarium albosuccineum TaxID=1237068 RepID=A0A8H4LPL7_9HYPO|nr:small s [Fusarium albosuccineum]
MATGLEALGAASAVLQVISFAGSVISLCYKIYDGQLTPENKLEEYASQMIDATERVRDRSQQVPSGTTDEKKLLEIAQKCFDASKSLQTETQLITRRYQKGKLFRAAYSAIASGHSKIEDLVIREAKGTRDATSIHVTSELHALGARAVSDNQRERLLKSLKAYEMNKRYHDVMDSEEASFERVFVSYERVCRKDPEHRAWQKMKKALDIEPDWLVSKKTVDEIDRLWDGFSSWLQSNDDIFWIRGKPGSGKSTLFKFIVNNDNTKRLLDSWSPNITILSHFFWKIGSEPQNSIKGLLCSLMYGVLCEDNSAVDQVLDRFPSSSSKDSYHDWSVRELEDILFSVLSTRTYSTCIFIDGLDEISDRDGFSKLMRFVEKLKSRKNVKVCVSSRPETQLVNRLQSIGAKSLRLEDLTRPEMALNVHNQLKQFEENRQISTSFLETCTFTLLEKAHGVFLWLFLAMKSLINGIENCDDEKTLLNRLEELPRELEALYESMWARLNTNSPIYRETAGRYFRYAIADKKHISMWKAGNRDTDFVVVGLSLAQLALLEELKKRELFPPRTNDMSLAGLNSSCETTANNVHTRCAGMLQMKPYFSHYALHGEAKRVSEKLQLLIQTVEFIHRTAHDFLTDTEAGQRILNYKHDESAATDTDVKLFKGLIWLAIVFAREFDLVMNAFDILEVYIELMDISVDQDIILGCLPIIESLLKEGVLGDSRPAWYPRMPFLTLLATKSPLFDDFIMSSLEQADSSSVATNILRDIVVTDELSGLVENYRPPTILIMKIMTLGANPHDIGMSLTHVANDLWSFAQTFTQKITAFELFLRGAICQLSSDDLGDLPTFVLIIDAMARTCPDWHRKTLIMPRGQLNSSGKMLRPFGWEDSRLMKDSFLPWGACEVDLQFLLTLFLAAADFRKVPTHDSKLHELANSFTEPHARLRHIIGPLLYGEDDFCYRVLARQPFQGLIHYIFGPMNGHRVTSDEFHSFVDALDNSHSLHSSAVSIGDSISGIYEKVSYEAELDALAGEGLGLCRLSDLGIYPPAVDDSDTGSQSEGSVESFSD